MEKNVKSIFDEECSHVRIDAELIKRINQYQIEFVNKNEDHMTFFGGNLTGVQIVRFTTQDKEKWFNDVLRIDDITIEERVLELPTINANRHVSSDIFNISVLWVIHSILNSHMLTDKQKENGCIDAALVLNYKFLTSLLFRYYKYAADPDLAEAAYSQLSLKFILKQKGSWSATLLYRAENLLDPQGIWSSTLKELDSDKDLVECLNDTQGRIRDMMKNIYSVLVDVKTKGLKVKKTSSTIEFEGQEILKDKNKSLINYTRYLHSIITDPNSFIKDELLEIVKSIQHTMPPKLLIKTLDWVSLNYRKNGAAEIDELVDLCLTHSFSYIGNHRNLVRETNDLASLVTVIRGVYMSSRSSDLELLRVREKAQTVVAKATGITNESIIASVRTGLLLYIILRAYSMHYYS
jgi:hypothetical protein